MSGRSEPTPRIMVIVKVVIVVKVKVEVEDAILTEPVDGILLNTVLRSSRLGTLYRYQERIQRAKNRKTALRRVM